MAGANILNPTIGQQLTGAAVQQREQQTLQMHQAEAERKKQEALREQMMRQALPDVLSQIDWQNPQNAQSQLAQAGLGPQEIATLFNIHKGGTELEQQDRSIGLRGQELALRKEGLGLQRQAMSLKAFEAARKANGGNEPRKLTPAEIRLNKANLEKLDVNAKASQEQLKQLEALEKAYETFDKEATGPLSAGSFISNLLPESGGSGVFHKGGKAIENTLYNDKARASLHTINKINSLLLQQRVKTLKGAGNVFIEKQIKEGLPRADIAPEARKENINSLKQEAFKNLLEQKFFTTWSELNGKDTNSAGAAFQEFLSTIPLADESGKLNATILQEIPSAVQDFLIGSNPANDDESSSDEGFENFNYNFE